MEYGLPAAIQSSKRYVFVVFFSFLLLLVIWSCSVTQWLAHHLNYHSTLGGFHSVYLPWSWFEWQQDFGHRYPSLFRTAKSFGSLVFVVCFSVMAFATLARKNRLKGVRTMHGSARWATMDEIVNMGCLVSEGVYVGGFIDPKKKALRYLMHDGAEHVLAFAPTRSGKGVGLVVPTLLSWKHSMLVLDIKGENYALSAGWRRKYLKQTCIKFDPSSLHHTARFNPMQEIRFNSPHETSDVQNLAMLIADPLGKGLVTHWDKQAFALISGVIMYDLVLASNEGTIANLPRVAAMMSDPERSESELWEEMLACAHPFVASVGRDMVDKEDDERASVVSTAKGHLILYKDPIVAKNIEQSDFKIADLMNHERPVSLYLVAQPADKDRMLPILRIFVAQSIKRLCPELTFSEGKAQLNYKHRLLLLLDEFPSLGRIEVLEQSLAFIAGYGLKAYLIAQDLEQLNKAYGEHENITSNCHIQVCYAPNKPKTAQYINQKAGVTTILKKSVNISGSRFKLFLKNTSHNIQETKRDLLTVDEIMRLPSAIKSGNDIVQGGDMLIFVAGNHPIYGRQILFFNDPVFSERVKIDAGHTDVIAQDNQSLDQGEHVRVEYFL